MSKVSHEAGLRVALINPELPSQSTFERLGRSDLPPLGLLYLAASLDAAGHAVRVFDLNLASHRRSWAEQAVGWEPHLVGFTTTALTFAETIGTARTLRNQLGARAKFVVGGADATIRPHDYLAQDVFDAVFVGEAEDTLVEVCGAWPDLAPRPGVLTRAAPQADRPPKIDPDATPFPARHLLPLKEYRGGPAFKRRRFSTSIFTHRGCPYNCRFCEQAVHDGRIRFRSADSIWEEVHQIRERYDIHDLRFIDDVLMCNRTVLQGFLELVQRSGERFDWMCTGRVDLMEPNLVREMKQAGCYRIEIGIESGDEQTLATVDKQFTTRDALDAVRTARAAGVEIVANYLIGLPGESRAAMERTVDLAVRVDADYPIFFLFTPFQGAALSREHGLKLSPAHPGFRAPSPAYAVPTEEVVALIDDTYGRLYFSASYVWRRLKSTRSPWIVWDLARMAASHLVNRLRGSAKISTGKKAD